ncbi:MAG: S8 family peptidase [Actinomycetota bacterium]|nr:S8 family peptidase [Actinomycetota bacterium]
MRTVIGVKRKTLGIIVVLALLLTSLTAVSAGATLADRGGVRSIVVFKPGANAPAGEAIGRLGGVKLRSLPLVNGAVFMLPEVAAERAVRGLTGVEYVERDALVYAVKKPTPAPAAEIVPANMYQIEADQVWDENTGDGVKVAIVDTGIDVKHSDLTVAGGVSEVVYTGSYADDNGHGTHVAGIVAALDNTIGVVGVGSDIDLYAVKVLNRKGSGYTSDIIAGLEWCNNNDIDVVNMSLGSSVYVQSFQDACTTLYESGTVIVAAAGNTGTLQSFYPAAYAGVVGVGAVDSVNAIASFSTYGPHVDLVAPGVNIYSTYKGDRYATMSGTSMAAPHVAGVAALVIKADTDGWDPDEIVSHLQSSALDLGSADKDVLYGYGLVQAADAVLQ